MASASNEQVDLYAGLALPAPKKRSAAEAERTDSSRFNTLQDAVKARSADSSSEARNSRASKKVKPTEIDVASAVARLKTHMAIDKKFAKAAALFAKLMAEKLFVETRSVFLDALTELIAAKGSTWSGKPEFAALIQRLLEKQDLFPEAERTIFKDWQLLAITHRDLFTDDSFQFARASKLIKQRLDAAVEGADRDQRAAQLAMLMPLLRTLFRRHSVAWAKVSVESALGVCTRHRLLFSEVQRQEVDLWTKSVQERRHASTISRNAASDARRNIVELTSDNASQAQAKVGRSNHPLFNRNT